MVHNDDDVEEERGQGGVKMMCKGEARQQTEGGVLGKLTGIGNDDERLRLR